MTMETKNRNWKKMVIVSFVAGIGMWIVGGLWHNLILPAVDNSIHPHHQGLGIVLIAYVILGLLMSYLYTLSFGDNKSWKNGVLIGVMVGVLWVFPHGLSMAATHGTSIIYEFKNTLYHVFEQGIGGVLVFWVFKVKSVLPV